MKILSYLFTICLALTSVAKAQENTAALMPLPNLIKTSSTNNKLDIRSATSFHYNAQTLDFAASQLSKVLQQRLQLQLSAELNTRSASNLAVQLLLDPSIQGAEHYILDITEKQLSIKGSTPASVLYGVYTLDQLLLGDAAATQQKLITPIFIDDSPLFPLRSLMLDPARHFIPVEDVKKYIDQMAKYKFNVLQLHLTDDQGWRIEIKSHPKLTQIGAFRKPKEKATAGDNGFYSQEQIKDLVAYAAKRNVEIIPEIDVPGHTVAMLTAYPDLRCDFQKDAVFDIDSTEHKMLSAANPKVYSLLDDVLKEISSLFPSKKIHLGGDESDIALNWAKSPEHQALMKKLGYNQPEQLMHYFFNKVLAAAKKYNLHTILWCELDNVRMPANKYLFDYPQHVTLVSWRNGLTPKCIELTGIHQNALILAPGEYCYLDYPQYSDDFPEKGNWGMPITTLEKTQSFRPLYDLPKDKTDHIIGIMGTIWGEAVRDINRANYMTWPRGLALSEAAWTKQELRGWDSFKKRMYPNILELMKNGTSVRAPFEIVSK
ncbi:beta-N-acetylhexosaminidase [Sphingobacterium sp. N143]|uniref:beta-N-acetylhexosaminidase n=1 Tax=Sphingobacterium sp. N143 TaxID=2746727 RepID=UPI002578D8BB|nr:beta-N-acetylhexosaminidase [Sphingobacterium sp. N143]MDM1296157.1 beta-N-acetylhexosaminidase [Sphingobacterium sp. N143]